MADVWIKRGDTTPALTAVLRDAESAPVDIADATVRFYMRAIGGETVIEAEEASNDQVGDGSDGTLGAVSYEWTETDTQTAGGYHGEFEVTFEDGSVETFPNSGYISIAILADIAAAEAS